MRAKVLNAEDKTSTTGKPYQRIQLEDQKYYSNWEGLALTRDDVIEFDVQMSKDGKFANIKNIKRLAPDAPLPEGFSTQTIVKQVEAELQAEGKSVLVHPPKATTSAVFVPEHWELLNKEALRAELGRARSRNAESYAIGQLINLIRYEEISEKLTALIDVTSKLYNKLGESR